MATAFHYAPATEGFRTVIVREYFGGNEASVFAEVWDPVMRVLCVVESVLPSAGKKRKLWLFQDHGTTQLANMPHRGVSAFDAQSTPEAAAILAYETECGAIQPMAAILIRLLMDEAPLLMTYVLALDDAVSGDRVALMPPKKGRMLEGIVTSEHGVDPLVDSRWPRLDELARLLRDGYAVGVVRRGGRNG